MRSAPAHIFGRADRIGWLERRTKKNPAPKTMMRGASQTTACRSLSPELNVAWAATSAMREKAKSQRIRLTGSERNAYSQPAAKNARSHIDPPDHRRERRFSWRELRTLFANFLRSSAGSWEESVARTTEGSAVESPALRAMFWRARPVGRPVTERLRPIHGPATRT